MTGSSATLQLPVADAVDVLTCRAGARQWLGASPAGDRLRPGCEVALPGGGRTGRVVSVADGAIRVELVDDDGGRSPVTYRCTAAGPRSTSLEADSDAADVARAVAAARVVAFHAVDRRTPRQAVVFIHGIGEQTPGATIRSFVDGVLPGGRRAMSKPDRFADGFELRRLQAWADREEDVPRTDFFEYYWADKLRDTPRSQVVSWLVGLARRRRRDTPTQLHTLWLLLRLTPLVLAAVALGVGWLVGIADVGAAWRRVAGLAPSAIVLGALGGAIGSFLTSSLGDAARYLKAHPANVAVRNRIRGDGIELLRRLEDSGRYHRIVVVGHSLGSVIAYDVLTHHWADRGTTVASSTTGQPALDAYEAKAAEADVAEHHGLQHELWREQRRLGSSWLVTDLVTLGSPLTHALLLMADDADDLDRRIASRELPTAPPVPDADAGGVVSAHPYSFADVPHDPDRPRVLHHAAPFGPTRWTNLYFPARAGLFGDPVGGPVTPVFGRGVEDGAVTRSRGARTPKCHSLYWTPDPHAAPGAVPDALAALRHALSLDSGAALRELAARLPVSTFVPDDPRVPF